MNAGSAKISAIISYIKSNDLMDLNWIDLKGMTAYDVLDHFGIGELLTEWEEALLMCEMELMAHPVQTSEISRVISRI